MSALMRKRLESHFAWIINEGSQRILVHSKQPFKYKREMRLNLHRTRYTCIHCGCFVSFTLRKFAISLFHHRYNMLHAPNVGRCWNASRTSFVRNFVRRFAIHFAHRFPLKISIEWNDVYMKSILIKIQMQYSCYNDIIDYSFMGLSMLVIHH